MTSKQLCFNASIRGVYDHKVFGSLPSFRQAKANLERHRAQLVLLGDVICKHELHDVFGVNLLHQHFGLYEDEQMVKWRDLDTNQSFIEPREIDPDHVGYFWKPTISRGSYVYSPTEFFSRQKTVPIV